MTPEQFDALAELLQSRHGPAELAARLVLVNGEAPSEAARAAGITPASASDVVTRYKRAHDLALQVVPYQVAPYSSAEVDEWRRIQAEIESQINVAISAEREACAALCDLHAAHYINENAEQLTHKAASNAARWLAKAIRARADK